MRGMPDEQIEYYFQAAKALGAKGITRELSEEAAKRLGPIADKHEIMIGFHNHTQLKPTTYDGDMLSYGKYLGINFDIGHYVAGTNQLPHPADREAPRPHPQPPPQGPETEQRPQHALRPGRHSRRGRCSST